MIDDFATVIGQAMGWPPTAGRMAAVLLLSDQPMTVQQLQDELEASVGTVSELTRLLITNGVVARSKPAGARHFVYEWRPDAWVGCLGHMVRQAEQLRELSYRAEHLGADLPALQQRRLQDMVGYYDLLVARLRSALEEYNASL
ncbi:regulatory ArsR family protein [Saccharopolyspora erythraea NRRL 2338]|uniref:Uncharacterized protein n=2 Tax=Saccharopolyspora erythraea TaxID=1836 RepID=A4FKV2_SACEN|nr:regulatory ArsR family protein [Saccharopolyspora erythraea NRRL 2338]CAM04677.1 hypothetical protein SACE_5443 [Saccharopolyspora erythraea NRRL 2338]